MQGEKKGRHIDCGTMLSVQPALLLPLHPLIIPFILLGSVTFLRL